MNNFIEKLIAFFNTEAGKVMVGTYLALMAFMTCAGVYVMFTESEQTLEVIKSLARGWSILVVAVLILWYNRAVKNSDL